MKNRPKRSEEHTSELQSLRHLVCRLLLEKKKKKQKRIYHKAAAHACHRHQTPRPVTDTTSMTSFICPVVCLFFICCFFFFFFFFINGAPPEFSPFPLPAPFPF